MTVIAELLGVGHRGGAAGMRDAAKGAKLQVEPQSQQMQIQQLVQAKQLEAAQDERTKGKAYAESAAKEEGAVTLPSGLVYRTLQPGKGANPKATDVVTVHYTGTLVSGEVFDSSVQRGQPAEFTVGGVIPCWRDGRGAPVATVGGEQSGHVVFGDYGTTGDGLMAARITLSLPQEERPNFVKAVYQANFVHDRDIADPQILHAAARRAGLDPLEVLAAMTSEPMKELLRDESLRKSGSIVEVPHKVRGSYFTVGSPIKFSDLKPNVTASPLLGEHTDEVLAELGYTPQQIAAMHEAKAV